MKFPMNEEEVPFDGDKEKLKSILETLKQRVAELEMKIGADSEEPADGEPLETEEPEDAALTDEGALPAPDEEMDTGEEEDEEEEAPTAGAMRGPLAALRKMKGM